jgi:hypothetical protein
VGKCILIADDRPVIRKTLRKTLEREDAWEVLRRSNRWATGNRKGATIEAGCGRARPFKAGDERSRMIAQANHRSAAFFREHHRCEGEREDLPPV